MKVFISTSRNTENIEMGLREGVWGNKKKMSLFKEGVKGDILLLREKKSKMIAICEVMGSPFESSENPWDDGNYSNMIPIRQYCDIILDKEAYKKLVDIVPKGNSWLFSLSASIEFLIMKPFFDFIDIKFEDNTSKVIKKPLEKKKNGFVYTMRYSSNPKQIKVGKTCQSEVEKRRKQLQTGSPELLEIIDEYPVENPHKIETEVHNILDIFECRINNGGGKEWYEIDAKKLRQLIPKIIDFIEG